MEHATFLPSDPAVVVEASLACPLCLHAVDWETTGRGARAEVACRCRSCGDVRNVELSGAQLLRLAALDEDEPHIVTLAGAGPR
jgi:hypothetical protein